MGLLDVGEVPVLEHRVDSRLDVLEQVGQASPRPGSRGRRSSVARRRLGVVRPWRHTSARTATAAASAPDSAAVEATLRAAYSTVTRGGRRCSSTHTSCRRTRSTRTPGSSRTVRRASMAMCIGAALSPWRSRGQAGRGRRRLPVQCRRGRMPAPLPTGVGAGRVARCGRRRPRCGRWLSSRAPEPASNVVGGGPEVEQLAPGHDSALLTQQPRRSWLVETHGGHRP